MRFFFLSLSNCHWKHKSSYRFICYALVIHGHLISFAISELFRGRDLVSRVFDDKLVILGYLQFALLEHMISS